MTIKKLQKQQVISFAIQLLLKLQNETETETNTKRKTYISRKKVAKY